MSTVAQELPYAPPPRWHQRRGFRRLLRLAIPPLVVLIAFSAWWSVREWRERARVLYWQRQCMAYAPTPGRVAYDDDPARVAELRRTPGYVASGTGAILANPAWQSYAGRSVQPVVFVRSLRSPSGNERLVVVQCGESGAGRSADPLGRLFLTPHVALPGTLTLPVRSAAWLSAGLEMCRDPADTTRLFEGQADPVDQSHFTVDYVYNGTAGTIDGWLNDDDTVTLSPRAGRVVAPPGAPVWWSPGKAAMPAWGGRPGNTRDAATQPIRPPRG